jgi:hypothetical protein
MATASEQEAERMVHDHERRLRAVERDLEQLKPPEKDDKPKK